MTLTPTIERAIKRASLLHKDQKRHSEENAPYVTHLFSVAALLSEYAAKEDVIVAGLLHDTLEDTPYSEAELEHEFGRKVLDIVSSVTEASAAEKEVTMFSWKERKDRYLEKLKTASAEALMVSAADKIHNLRSLITGFEKEGSDIWKNFNKGPREQLWFFESVLNILEERLDSAIVPELRKVFEEAKNLFTKQA